MKTTTKISKDRLRDMLEFENGFKGDPKADLVWATVQEIVGADKYDNGVGHWYEFLVKFIRDLES
jgi:hypothetical protein